MTTDDQQAAPERVKPHRIILRDWQSRALQASNPWVTCTSVELVSEAEYAA